MTSKKFLVYERSPKGTICILASVDSLQEAFDSINEILKNKDTVFAMNLVIEGCENYPE